jgi:hypothetical protein
VLFLLTKQESVCAMSQKQLHHIDNRIALPIDASNPESLLITQPMPQNTKEAHALRKVPGLHHFTMVEKLGCNPVFHCWCGASLEINYQREGMLIHESCDAMTSELAAFCREHSECEPFVNGMQEERDTGGADA